METRIPPLTSHQYMLDEDLIVSDDDIDHDLMQTIPSD